MRRVAFFRSKVAHAFQSIERADFPGIARRAATFARQQNCRPWFGEGKSRGCIESFMPVVGAPFSLATARVKPNFTFGTVR
jgi:hypothetical protein